MAVIERPDKIRLGGKGVRVFRAAAEVEGSHAALQARHTAEFDLSGDEPAQRMLLAVAGFADECGIASDWDEATNTARGVSVAELALKAGIPLHEASTVLDELCLEVPGRKPHLYRLETKPPARRGLVWVLPDYEDEL